MRRPKCLNIANRIRTWNRISIIALLNFPDRSVLQSFGGTGTTFEAVLYKEIEAIQGATKVVAESFPEPTNDEGGRLERK